MRFAKCMRVWGWRRAKAKEKKKPASKDQGPSSNDRIAPACDIHHGPSTIHQLANLLCWGSPNDYRATTLIISISISSSASYHRMVVGTVHTSMW